MVLEERIGAGVKEARVRRGVSQAALASTMSRYGHERWSQSTVWAVESGQRPLRLSEAVSIAKILHVQVAELASGAVGPVGPASIAELRHQIEEATAELCRRADATKEMP